MIMHQVIRLRQSQPAGPGSARGAPTTDRAVTGYSIWPGGAGRGLSLELLAGHSGNRDLICAPDSNCSSSVPQHGAQPDYPRHAGVAGGGAWRTEPGSGY